MVSREVEITVEQAWDARKRAHRAARRNPFYRSDPPRLEEMDSEGSKKFIRDLEKIYHVRITDEENQEHILKGRISLGVTELGEIANYLGQKRYGGSNGS